MRKIDKNSAKYYLERKNGRIIFGFRFAINIQVSENVVFNVFASDKQDAEKFL
ncbi:MAG: hypothetical protein ABJA32_04245 [Ginsengibacter sp.]